MLAIEKWAKNKSPFIALFAPQMALNVRDMHQGFQHIQARRILNYQVQLPHLPSWFILYRTHRKPLAFLRSLLLIFLLSDKKGSNLQKLPLKEGSNGVRLWYLHIPGQPRAAGPLPGLNLDSPPRAALRRLPWICPA
jgi:hypothetical protein